MRHSSLRPNREDLAALAALASELAGEPTPELDWRRVERRLHQRIECGAEPSRSARAGWGRTLARASGIGAAAAAVAALLVSARNTRGEREVVAPIEGETTAEVAHLPGGTLLDPASASFRAGEIAETENYPALYEIPGRLVLELSDHSSLRVLSVGRASCSGGGQPVIVELVRGSIYVDVAATPDCEIFSVQVAQTRIAVHGTSFGVARRDDRAFVEVARGSVAVGPANHTGTTQGWLVVAPDRAAFSLDGGNRAEWLGAQPLLRRPNGLAPNEGEGPAARQEHPVEAGASGGTRSAGVSGRTDDHWGNRRARSRNDAPYVEGEAIAQGEVRPADPAAIVAQIRDCYVRQLAASEVEFSVHSSLTLMVATDGAVSQAAFRPPLSPTLMVCASEAIRQARLPRTQDPSVTTVKIDLTP